MKKGIYRALALVCLFGVFVTVSLLESDAIGCGLALLLSALCLAGLGWFAYIGGMFYEGEEKKRPARLASDKAAKQNISLKV